MKLVVTGATGHLGRSVVELALAEGHDVVAASRDGRAPASPWGAPAREPHATARLTTFPVELTRDSAVGALAALLGPEVVLVHLAALHPAATAKTAIDDLSTLIDVNVHGTMRALEACRRARAARVVYASTFEVYGDPPAGDISEDARLAPLTDYGATKLAGEDHARSFAYEEKTPFTALRMPALYGPGERTPRALPNFLEAVARGERPTIAGDGLDVRDQLHVRDAARAVLLAATGAARGIFNVNDGARHTIVSLARAAMTAADMEGEPNHRPAEKPRRDYHMNVARARAELGFAPAIDLATGVREQLAWIRAGRP